jgi:hypothetical protein
MLSIKGFGVFKYKTNIRNIFFYSELYE